MTKIIRTKWHKVISLFVDNEVYLTAPTGGDAKHWQEFNPNLALAGQFMRNIGDLPKFVIEKELMDVATKENFQGSLIDMKRAGVLRLPFPAMTVEFDTDGGNRVIIMLRDTKSPEVMPWEPPLTSNEKDDLLTTAPFYGIVIRVDHDEEGEYVVMSPSLCTVDINTGPDGKPWLQMWGTPHEIFEYTPKLSDLIEKTYAKDTAWLWRGLLASMLLMHTGGVEREVIECEKLNRKRLNSKKPLVPRHTYLHIGRVYKSSAGGESSEYIPRQSPIPHWRKGHLKTVRHGPGRASVKEIYVNPMLVAFREFEDDEPTMKKEYHVSK